MVEDIEDAKQSTIIFMFLLLIRSELGNRIPSLETPTPGANPSILS